MVRDGTRRVGPQIYWCPCQLANGDPDHSLAAYYSGVMNVSAALFACRLNFPIRPNSKPGHANIHNP